MLSETGISMGTATYMEEDSSSVLSSVTAVVSPDDLHAQTVTDSNGETRNFLQYTDVSDFERDKMETGMVTYSCSYSHNIQALAENNYIQNRTECDADDTEMLDLTHTVRGGIGHSQHSNKYPETKPSHMGNSEHMGNRGDNVSQMNIQTRGWLGRLSDTVYPTSERVSHATASQSRHLGSFGDCKAGNSDKGLPVASSSKHSSDTHSINLQQSDYISLLTLPVTIGEDTCMKCNVKTTVPHEDYSQSTASAKYSADTQCPSQSNVADNVRQPGECFKLDFASSQQNNINYLPSSILVQVFRNLSVFGLLQRASLVCKYWYNLCRDPDLWVNISLVNQHRLKDCEFQKVILCTLTLINL